MGHKILLDFQTFPGMLPPQAFVLVASAIHTEEIPTNVLKSGERANMRWAMALGVQLITYPAIFSCVLLGTKLPLGTLAGLEFVL